MEPLSFNEISPGSHSGRILSLVHKTNNIHDILILPLFVPFIKQMQQQLHQKPQLQHFPGGQCCSMWLSSSDSNKDGDRTLICFFPVFSCHSKWKSLQGCCSLFNSFCFGNSSPTSLPLSYFQHQILRKNGKDNCVSLLCDTKIRK